MIELGSDCAADTLKLQKAFARLSEKAQDGILRPIMTAASKVVAEAERQAAPRESGLMQDAIGASTTRTYRTGASSRLYIAAGVRWGFRRIVTNTPRGKLKIDRSSQPEAGDAGARDPARYLYPVVKGRQAVAAKDRKILYDAFTKHFLGRQVQPAPPNRFIEETYRRIAPQIETMIAGQGQAAIEQTFKT